MSEQKSYPHLAYRMPGDAMLSTAIADELYSIVTRAAHPVQPGESIEAQQNRAWENLGKPKRWRLLAAWWRDGSGQWSAAAVKDFQARYAAFLAREAARSEHAKAIQAAMQSVSVPKFVEIVRADYEDICQRLAAVEAALRLHGPD